MAREFSRTRRVAEQLQREIAEVLQREVQDPRLAHVTVSGVEISKDLAHARVYYTTVDEDSGSESGIANALQRAGGFVRSQLAHRMRMRVVPELRFIHDESLAEGERVDRLLAGLDARREPQGGEDG